MIDVQSSAPGKVIVTGEYAVLDGAAAVCMAIDRRAQVSVRSAAGQPCIVSAPGFDGSESRFATLGESAGTFPLLGAVVRELEAESADGLEVVLDTAGFSPDGSGKIGLGSSAALTVALVGALDRVTGNKRNIRACAMAAHRRFQQGAGSGADVATSMTGGVIEYRIGEETDRVTDWPPGLYFRLFWSGVPADTRVQLQKMATAEPRRARADLALAADTVAGAWREGNAGTILAAIGSYTRALQRFDTDHGLGIFGAGHDRLAKLAASFGAVYKPCGAGAGDLGIVLTTDEDAIGGFSDGATRRGFEALGLAVDATGLAVSGGRQ